MANIDHILAGFPRYQRDNLIPILQKIQEEFGYIPEEAIIQTGKHLMLPAAKIFGVASFYDHFRFTPRGTYHLVLCKGTSCHLNEGESLVTELEKTLKIKHGQVTRDGRFSVEYSPCMGACGAGPVLSVNGNYHNYMDSEKLHALLDELMNL